MRRSVVLAVLAGVLISSTAASADEVRFRGAFTITSIKNCLARYIGETFNSAYRPANLGDNGPVTSLSQLNTYSGDVYELNGANFAFRQWNTVAGNGIDNIHYSFNARIYISEMAPRVVTPTTNHLSIDGIIQNMGNDPGVNGQTCVAGFRASYFRRIEQP